MLKEGDGVVELGLGFPNLMPTIVDQSGLWHSGLDFFTDDQTKSFGQLNVKGEFMMSDRIGVIGVINYGYFSTHNVEEWSEYDPATQSYYTASYYYNTKVHKVRFTGGINIHVVRTNRVDSYFGFLAGTKKAYLKYDTNNPFITTVPEAFVIPFAVRAQYGVRFFFNDFLAGHMELGLGGPLISVGMTYKF